MPEARTIFVVRPVNPPSEDAGREQTRLIRATRRSQVESFLISEFSIDKATQEQCVDLGADGVKVEDAGLGD